MLTMRQQQVLEIIKQWQQEHGVSPTISEIADLLQVKSRSMVQRILAALEQRGYLQRETGVQRNLRLITQTTAPCMLPLLGRISAGHPIAAVEDQEAVDLQSFVADDRFILQVKGDSMSGDMIRDGDLVICERCDRPRSGDIVAVLIEREDTTLKRIQYQPDTQTVCLVPSNSAYQPRIYFEKDIQVQGRYLGLIRWGK
jgi:repressor LexA